MLVLPPLVLLVLVLPPVLTKRRGDAGSLRLRACGFWGLGAQCSAVQCQCSAAQRGKNAGWGAGGSRN